MIELNNIYNIDCLKFMDRMITDNFKVDLILTSPPYNIGVHDFDYDEYNDNMSTEDYFNFIMNVFEKFNKILNNNGVLLWNSSFGNSNCSDYFRLISKIITDSNFEISDRIIWKKSNAFPDDQTPNKLTRLVEDVFVFCRKNEMKTFHCNKKLSSIRPNGQKMYSPIFNVIEAKNNDGACELNKATYSSELCRKLLNIYARKEDVIFDPFIGTGTTAVACKQMGLNYIGCEISEKQVIYAKQRINNGFVQEDVTDEKLNSLPLFLE